ncbi:hypothetical protein EYF80_052271 [Liparis tanakae]|uniref:Uncharacterized protein n=1 Tax=Liparis tanakae TaxID=230148 RepID=A0A4Z2F9H8_9TELE|nr:hypothetical protein EYF80_052271 [Liparis tanakae]
MRKRRMRSTRSGCVPFFSRSRTLHTTFSLLLNSPLAASKGNPLKRRRFFFRDAIWGRGNGAFRLRSVNTSTEGSPHLPRPVEQDVVKRLQVGCLHPGDLVTGCHLKQEVGL